MPSYTSMAVAAAALLQVGAANPISKRSTFTANQVDRGGTPKIGAVELAKAYSKFGGVAPDAVQAAAAAAVTGSVVAKPEDPYVDRSYLSTVTIGGQTFNLIFDTGSADLWVYSTLTPSSEVKGQTRYNPAKSKTSKELNGYTWKIGYLAGGGTGGVVYADKVVVGGVTATSQAVEAANSVASSLFLQSEVDGLLGLGFSSSNTIKPKPQNTFFDNVKGELKAPLFAATLKKGRPGSYDFGFIDNSKYTGALTYVNVDPRRGFWEFSIDGASANGHNLTGRFTAMADTGSSLIFLERAPVDAYWKLVKGARFESSISAWAFPCSAQLPNFTITVNGGVALTVPGSYINYGSADGTTTNCYGGIQYTPYSGLGILGEVFLKTKYVVFEHAGQTPRLAFANQK